MSPCCRHHRAQPDGGAPAGFLPAAGQPHVLHAVLHHPGDPAAPALLLRHRPGLVGPWSTTPATWPPRPAASSPSSCCSSCCTSAGLVVHGGPVYHPMCHCMGRAVCFACPAAQERAFVHGGVTSRNSACDAGPVHSLPECHFMEWSAERLSGRLSLSCEVTHALPCPAAALAPALHALLCCSSRCLHTACELLTLCGFSMGISMFRAISSATRNEVSSLIVGCFFFLALLLLGRLLAASL